MEITISTPEKSFLFVENNYWLSLLLSNFTLVLVKHCLHVWFKVLETCTCRASFEESQFLYKSANAERKRRKNIIYANSFIFKFCSI